VTKPWLDPRDVYALDGKGFALYNDMGWSLDPNFAGLLDNKGGILYKMGDYTGGLSIYNMVLKLDPRDEYAFYNKALGVT